MEHGYRVNRVKPTETIAPHTHGFIEIVYIFRGKGIHRIDGKIYSVRRGDLLVINYRSEHAVEPYNGLEYVDIMLKPEYVDEKLRGRENAFALLELANFREFARSVDRGNALMHLSGEERERFERLIEWTEEEQRTRGSGSGLAIRAALDLLLITLFRKMALPMNEPLAVNDALLSYIRENCGERISLERLAARCYYTPAHFSRLFKEYTGMTPTEYISECRIEKAKRLLSETALPVSEIITLCGFSSGTKFFRRFSERTGTTPLKYRKSRNAR